jgi:hypothetical protein
VVGDPWEAPPQLNDGRQLALTRGKAVRIAAASTSVTMNIAEAWSTRPTADKRNFGQNSRRRNIQSDHARPNRPAVKHPDCSLFTTSLESIRPSWAASLGVS